MDLSRDALKGVLERHGYPTIIMSPEWCAFAVNILVVEELEKITRLEQH